MYIGSTNACNTNWEVNKPVTNLFDPNESVVPDWLRTSTVPTNFPVTSPELSSITGIDEVEE